MIRWVDDEIIMNAYFIKYWGDRRGWLISWAFLARPSHSGRLSLSKTTLMNLLISRIRDLWGERNFSQPYRPNLLIRYLRLNFLLKFWNIISTYLPALHILSSHFNTVNQEMSSRENPHSYFQKGGEHKFFNQFLAQIFIDF